MNPRKQYDIENILRSKSEPKPPPEPKVVKKPSLTVLDRIEEDIPMPPKRCGAGQGKFNEYVEVLELMTPQKSSFLDDPKQEYTIRQAAKRLKLKVTYRVEDHRGTKLHRWWVIGVANKEE